MYKQKVKHLMYEHQNNLTEAKADTIVALKIAEDDHSNDNQHEWKQRQLLLSEANEKQVKHEASIKQLKLVCLEYLSLHNSVFDYIVYLNLQV